MSHSKAHRYRLSKFDRPNSYTSTTPADLISSTTRSRDTYRIPASVLDLSNEFAQPCPSPEHSSQYSSTYTNHVNFRYQNIHLSLQIQFRLRQDLHTCLICLLRQIPSSAHDETIRPNGHFERSTSTLADSILLPPVSESPIVHMLTRTMVLQKKPQYNTWHRTTTVR